MTKGPELRQLRPLRDCWECLVLAELGSTNYMTGTSVVAAIKKFT
jgi:hypothetical protein